MIVGFICDDRLPSFRRVLRGKCGASELFAGCRSGTSLGMMRVGWIADYVNSKESDKSRYEWYRPGRKYDAVIYVKSASDECRAHASSVRARGGKAIFDANVDYFSDTGSDVFYYNGMAPTAEQRLQAVGMAESCDAVIADSPHIANVAQAHSSRVSWVPDNIRDDLVLPLGSASHTRSGRLNVFWSGQAIKLFELLLIKDTLLKYRGSIRLIIITNSMKALDMWSAEQKVSFTDLLEKIEHEIIDFESVERLCAHYDRGGICLAPRHMDSSYNLGHTEWKIALAMARGVPALASPLGSYRKVWERSKGVGVHICSTQDEWARAFEECLGTAWHHDGESDAAIDVVSRFYKTSLIAEQHLQFVTEVVEKDQ